MFNVYFDPERNQISASVALTDNFPVAIEAAKKSQEQADVSGETAHAHPWDGSEAESLIHVWSAGLRIRLLCYSDPTIVRGEQRVV